MKRRMRWMVGATTVVAALGLAWGMDEEGGSGEGSGLSPYEREVLAEIGTARDLAALHAAVAGFVAVDEATVAGYAPSTGCVSSEFGAQGIHYAKDSLFEPSVVLETPQLLMYEPQADGSLRFVGVEYFVWQAAWHDLGHVERPTLFGQTFDLNETLRDEPFYLLHVWVQQFNPSGAFANWNPLVACEHDLAAAN